MSNRDLIVAAKRDLKISNVLSATVCPLARTNAKVWANSTILDPKDFKIVICCSLATAKSDFKKV